MFGFDDDSLDRIHAKRRPPSSERDSLFGFTHDELAKAQKRRFPWIRVALELGVLMVVIAVGGVLQLVTTPEGIQFIIDQAFKKAKMTITITDVEVTPTAELMDPQTWGLQILGVTVTPPNPGQPVITISRVGLTVPDPMKLIDKREIWFEQLDVVGLRIHAERQRPGKPWKVKETKVPRVFAKRVRIWDLNYEAMPDPPLASAAMKRVYGELQDVEYLPGSREVSGHGQVAIHAFHTGNLEVNHVHVHSLRAVKSDLSFEGTLSFADAEGVLKGSILHFHRKGKVSLQVRVKNARLENVVQGASGRASPILGRLDAVLDIRSGGDIPRGAGWMEGRAKLYNIRIPLRGSASDVVRDLIRVTPYLTLDQYDQARLEDMEGFIRVERGAVELQELLYKAPRRTIQVFGRMDRDERYLVVRAVPVRDPHVRPGIGIVLSGTERLRLRLAKRWDLLPDVYDPEPADRGAARQQRRAERKRARLLLRSQAAADTEQIPAEVEIDEPGTAPAPE